MKKGFLLLSTLLAGSAVFGQLTQANEPSAGSTTMYVVDTASANVPTLDALEAATGTSAIWNYSNADMSASSTFSVVTSNVNSNATFPSATKSINQGAFLQYFHSSASARTVDGFIYDDAGGFGEVTVKYASGNNYIAYPMNYGNSTVNNVTGNAETPLGDFTFTGSLSVKMDGQGTLRLPGLDITGVTRVAIKDVVSVSLYVSTIDLIRTQYEYYKWSESDMPIYTDATIEISGIGTERQILSKNLATVGLNVNAINNFTIYPNPTEGEFTINGEFAEGNVEVTDLAGRVVLSSAVSAGSKVELADAKAGIYVVKVVADGKTAIQKVTVK